jgi:hypothetical protein
VGSHWWPTMFPRARSQPSTRHGIACISRWIRCCDRLPTVGHGMSRAERTVRWPSTSWKKRSGAQDRVVSWCWTPGTWAKDVVQVLARRRQDGSSRLQQNRRLETASVQLRAAHAWPRQRPGPHLAVEALVSLIPDHAYRAVTVCGHT